MAKRKITLLYGEGTVQVYFRLPESKRDEIESRFWDILKEYENPTKVEIEVSNPFKSREHPLKEKKSNPADYITDEVAVEKHKKHNHKSSIAIGKGVYDAPKVENLINDEVGQFVKSKVDMEDLGKIAAGEGLKGEFSLTKKKVEIDELYDFEIGSLPDIDDRVYIDKKSIAMVDKYNPGVYYVIWEGRNLMFTKKAVFDRFAKEYLILI
jgi:hypothetical protein